MRGILNALKNQEFSLYCASNSVRKTVFRMLLRKGLIEYFDDFISNQDVKNPKPHPEMYWKLMSKHSLRPTETLIVEDSHTGREAAILSGATLCAVRDPEDVQYETIITHTENMKEKPNPKWQGGKLNVLIPMAGEGSRFSKAGFTFPKPLIEVNGKPMIQTVVENLNIDATHIFVVRKSHYEQYNLKYLLNLIAPNCKIVQVDRLTEGAACTTLLAKEYIDNEYPLVFANSDQYLDWNSNEFMYSMIADNVDGGILTFNATHPKWSFAKLNEDGFVSEVAEKKPISNLATCGIYYWKKGSDYVKYAEQMIEKNIRVNNEFYVCPVFNQAIQDGKKIKTFPVKKMWGIGTPEDLNTFLISKKEEK
jgi:dTDP-glucose pyrophosphorylase